MPIEFYIAQGISVLITIIAVLMMQFKSMTIILLGQISANLLTATTYFLLGGLSGAGICFIAIIQTVTMFVYNRKKKTPHIALILVFIALYIGCCIYYYQSIVDIFSALAAITFALSIAQQDSKKARIWYIFNPICWLIYSFFCQAYGNCITYSIIFVSTLIAMIRVDDIFKLKSKNSQ